MEIIAVIALIFCTCRFGAWANSCPKLHQNHSGRGGKQWTTWHGMTLWELNSGTHTCLGLVLMLWWSILYFLIYPLYTRSNSYTTFLFTFDQLLNLLILYYEDQLYLPYYFLKATKIYTNQNLSQSVLHILGDPRGHSFSVKGSTQNTQKGKAALFINYAVCR